MKIVQIITFSPIAEGGQVLAGLTEDGVVIIYDSARKIWEKLLIDEEVKGKPLEALPIKIVIINALRNAGYKTIEEIVQEFKLHGLNNFSRVSGLGYQRLYELQEAIEKLDTQQKGAK